MGTGSTMKLLFFSVLHINLHAIFLAMPGTGSRLILPVFVPYANEQQSLIITKISNYTYLEVMQNIQAY